MQTLLKPLALALVSSALSLSAFAVQAKCTVTLAFKNGNGSSITVLGDDSQARVNGGTWSKMNFTDASVPAGATRDVAWTTKMSCSGNAKRDLRVKYRQSNNNNVYQESFDNLQIDDGGTYNLTLKH